MDFNDYIEQYKGLIITITKQLGIYQLMEPEDILQEGYLVLWKTLLDYDYTLSNFSTFFWIKLEKHFINIKKSYLQKKIQATILFPSKKNCSMIAPLKLKIQSKMTVLLIILKRFIFMTI